MAEGSIVAKAGDPVQHLLTRRLGLVVWPVRVGEETAWVQFEDDLAASLALLASLSFLPRPPVRSFSQAA